MVRLGHVRRVLVLRRYSRLHGLLITSHRVSDNEISAMLGIRVPYAEEGRASHKNTKPRTMVIVEFRRRVPKPGVLEIIIGGLTLRKDKRIVQLGSGVRG